MRKGSSHLLSLSAGLVLVLVFAATKARGADETYRFTIDAGERWVDFKGSQDLYRSQLDFGEGPKLFGADFQATVPQGSNRYFDRFQLTLRNWGGEPYSSARLRLAKSDAYEVKFDYQEVKYFSSIPSFANPNFEQGNLQSRHVFDVGQRYSSLEVDFMPKSSISPFVAWDHNDRRGPVRTTLDLGGDEFVIGSDWNTSSNDYRGGVNFNLGKFSLMLEQGVRYYREKTSLFSTVPQTGNSTRLTFGRDIVLNNYSADNDTSASIPFSNAVAVWRPLESLSLRANATYSMADLDPSFADVASGVFFTRDFNAFSTGLAEQVLGTVKRPTFFGDFSAEWSPIERFRVIESVKTHKFHISSSALSNLVYLNFEPVLEEGIQAQFTQDTPLGSFLSFDNFTQELQGMFYVTPRLVARLGHRFERRKIGFEEDRFRYDRNVLITGLSYDFSARDRISAEYEYARTDRPILRTDAVDYHKASLRGRYAPFEKLQFEGNATLFDNLDRRVEALNFTSRQRNYALQFSYTPITRVSVTGGFERTQLRTGLLYIVPQTLTLDRSRYREKGNFGNLYLNVLLIRNANLSLGYSGWGVSGSFPLTYHRPSARLEVPVHERVSVYGQWNYYEYNEKVQIFPQDYLAHLIVFGFRVTVEKP